MNKIMYKDVEYGGTPPIIDLFYPIGSYYDTSDANFNPNVMWGGTWHLLDEGYVLISGSSDGSYKVGTNYGDNTKSYTPSGSVGNHTLNTNEIPSHAHVFPRQQWYGADKAINTNTSSIYSWKSGAGTGGSTSYSYQATSDGLYGLKGGGQAHSHGFTGTAATLDVMQASTPVYRWHRVA